MSLTVPHTTDILHEAKCLRLRLLAAVLELQHLTSLAANVVLIPGGECVLRVPLGDVRALSWRKVLEVDGEQVGLVVAGAVLEIGKTTPGSTLAVEVIRSGRGTTAWSAPSSADRPPVAVIKQRARPP